MTKERHAVGAASVAAEPAPRGCLIEARDVVRWFGQIPALRGACLSVAAGEVLAVMGPNRRLQPGGERGRRPE